MGGQKSKLSDVTVSMYLYGKSQCGKSAYLSTYMDGSYSENSEIQKTKFAKDGHNCVL